MQPRLERRSRTRRRRRCRFTWISTERSSAETSYGSAAGRHRQRFLADRGEVHHDPLVFAVTDRSNYAAVAIVVSILLLASYGGHP